MATHPKPIERHIHDDGAFTRLCDGAPSGRERATCLHCRTFCAPQLFTLRRRMYKLDVRVNTYVNTCVNTCADAGARPQRPSEGGGGKSCSVCNDCQIPITAPRHFHSGTFNSIFFLYGTHEGTIYGHKAGAQTPRRQR